jgi:UDP-3-O-[3-hydroxymyristoyl] glucosamine N-acyltransferase
MRLNSCQGFRRIGRILHKGSPPPAYPLPPASASLLICGLTMKLQEIASVLGCELVGDGSIEITGMAGMEHAGPTEVTFVANPKYISKIRHTRAAAIIVSEPVRDLPIASLVSSNPYLDFARALALFYQPPRPAPGIHPLAFVAPTAQIGEGASIGPFAVVGERVILGRNAVLHPHVVVYEAAEIGDDFYAHSHAVVREFCRIGNRVILQNGVVVGGDGFGFARRADGTHFKIVQSGVTVIEDDVEIQSLTSVDRATLGETRVKRGAKMDSLVQVGHACVIGEDNIICGQVGLAGSSVLGRNVLLAGQVGISGHLTIHDNAIVYAQSGIGGDVEAGARMSGSPAFDAKEWLRAVTAFPKLPELLRTIRELKKKVEQLEGAALKESTKHE